METSFFYPFAASLIAATVTTIGLLVIQRYKNWAEKNTVYFISFAAGVLISVSLIHIIPKSFSMNEHAPILLLTGFFSFHLLNRFIHGYVCHKAPGENRFVFQALIYLRHGIAILFLGYVKACA